MKRIFQLIVITAIILFGCGKTSDKEYMKLASENIEKGNMSEAISAYQKLVDEYPESELAPEAIVKQAALYHENKVNNIHRLESLNKAADLFISVSEKYPESEKAPSSLFMAGFIYANEIQDYTKAKAIYNLFLKKYPENELANAAKEELDNMGLTPEEILQKKLSAQDTK
jgi:TolA-binding protein